MSDQPPPYPAGPPAPGYGPPPGGQYPPPGGQYPPPGGQYPPAAGQYPPPAPDGSYPKQPLPPPDYSEHGFDDVGVAGQQQTTVVMQPVAMVAQFRESPIQTNCQHCHSQIVTAIHYETGTITWVAAAVICIVGCGLGCCLIPFCVNGAKDAVHSCPNCKQVVGRWNRM